MTLLDEAPIPRATTGAPEPTRAPAAGDPTARFEALVDRLNRQSVEKHFAAYEDVAWDDPEFAIDRRDPRWVGALGALAETDWFRSLPPETQSEIGLYHVAGLMKVGLQFENVLKRGLLEFAFELPNGDPTFRYSYHEVIEEGQHGMMFQEFVNRAGFDTPGLPRHLRRATRRVVALGRWFPELFFMFVLGGEDPIDHSQREALRRDAELPPVVERIMRIHVTEEARHLSFARHYLKLRAGELSMVRRTALGIGTPIILGVMAQLMMRPSRHLIRRYDIPAEVVRTVYTDNPEHGARTRDALRKVRRLSRELGIVTPLTRPLWKALGIWDDDTAAA
jgi:hypothetical protein